MRLRVAFPSDEGEFVAKLLTDLSNSVSLEPTRLSMNDLQRDGAEAVRARVIVLRPLPGSDDTRTTGSVVELLRAQLRQADSPLMTAQLTGSLDVAAGILVEEMDDSASVSATASATATSSATASATESATATPSATGTGSPDPNRAMRGRMRLLLRNTFSSEDFARLFFEDISSASGVEVSRLSMVSVLPGVAADTTVVTWDVAPAPSGAAESHFPRAALLRLQQQAQTRGSALLGGALTTSLDPHFGVQIFEVPALSTASSSGGQANEGTTGSTGVSLPPSSSSSATATSTGTGTGVNYKNDGEFSPERHFDNELFVIPTNDRFTSKRSDTSLGRRLWRVVSGAL
jgi:hypothetical protein